MKAAIVVFSDPKTGTEESLGRVFNALAAAYDYQQNGDEVTIQFQCAVRNIRKGHRSGTGAIRYDAPC